ncbi:HesA/MoeB/ThiF family protein [Francisellaceae bacterium]|nr:HesA/MoeB/ThiF family protein [Francisellaceae bacterium]
MDYERYQRHFPIIGIEGQQKLLNAKICIVGCGGLGAPVALYLAAAGIGKIGLVDADIVDLSNLQRQIIYKESDINKPKVECAQEALQTLNSTIAIQAYPVRLNADNIHTIIKDYDLIIDGSDNFETKYLVNDICCQLGIPFISASILKHCGQLLISNAKTGCYRCIYPEKTPDDLVPNCAQAGVMGYLVGIIGTMIANLASNYFLSREKIEFNTLMVYDSNIMSFKKYKFHQNKSCLACIEHQHPKYESSPIPDYNINPKDLSAFKIVDIREHWERKISPLSYEHIHILLNDIKYLSNPISTSKPILFVCKSGIRSNKAAHQYHKLFPELKGFSLKGGLRSRSAV